MNEICCKIVPVLTSECLRWIIEDLQLFRMTYFSKTEFPAILVKCSKYGSVGKDNKENVVKLLLPSEKI